MPNNLQFHTHTHVEPARISIVVELPAPLDLTERDAELLVSNLHNAVELALAAVPTKEQ